METLIQVRFFVVLTGTKRVDHLVSPIPEFDDDIQAPNGRVAVGISETCDGNIIERKWSFAPQKIYKSIVRKGHRLTHDAADLLSNTRPLLRRRHSTGPFRIASAAKDLLVNSRRTFRRQASDFGRSVLPRPPAEFFEPSDLPKLPSDLRPEVFYLSHNLKTLELPDTWNLNTSDIKVEDYDAGDIIVKSGDIDCGMIVVLEGAIAVYIRYGESKEYMVRRIEKGDSFSSPLSLLEILMVKHPYSMISFRSLYLKNPREWMRPIQIAITRLLHVTMTTLHQYLGLRSELLKQRDEKKNLEEKVEALKKGYVHGKLATLRSGSMDENRNYLELGRRYFADALNLTKHSEAAKILYNCLRIVSVPENGVLTEQNSEEDRLFVVVDGTFMLTQQPIYDDEGSAEEGSVTVYPKEMLGGLWLLTSEPSFYTVRACSNAKVAVLSKADFLSILEVFPEALLFTAYSVLRRLSSFTRSVDFGIDWVVLDSGQAVYRHIFIYLDICFKHCLLILYIKSGDTADSFFVVLSGRLRSVEKKTVVEEFGRGDIVGMIEVLQRVSRSTTVLAVRLSQLACIPEGLLNYVKMKFPQVGFRLVHLLGQHYSSNSKRATTVSKFSDELAGLFGDPRSHIKNLHTIAVVPASNDVPLAAFVCELYYALSSNLRVLRLSSQKVAERLGHEVLEKQVDFRLMHWLNLQEDIFPLVIYVCDYTATNWTGRCLRQADAILLVANGLQKPPKHSFMEEYLNSNPDGIRTNKELVLLWDENTVAPSGTIEWLKERWFSGHHHIRCPSRMKQWCDVKVSVDEKLVVDYYQSNVFGKQIDRNSDFARLGRILTGNAVGLVLGGGGARGAAHIGVIQAMQEEKIPVDMIGGVSIGSLIGGLYADCPTTLKEKANQWFLMMGSVWRQIWDLTYAHSAMFTGAGFNNTLLSVFGDKQIEDLWIPYFCISTDISESVMRVHRRGPLWSYARSSMSLAGYLPPLCDPIDGHLLLDGGYVNNLPADVMKTMGAKIVIAVDVGSASDTDLYNYGDSLSGFWVLFKKLNPFGENVKVLNMEEIQSRLAYVSCVRHLEQVKKASYCHYVRPPIDSFKTLDFVKFDQIVEIGYVYGSKVFPELIENDEDLMAATGAFVVKQVKHHKKGLSKSGGYNRSRASSFANLAAQVSRIPKNQSHGSSLDDDFEDDVLEQIQEIALPGDDNDDFSLASELGYLSEPCTIQKEFFFSDSSADEEASLTTNEVNENERQSGLTEFYFDESKAAEKFRSKNC
uniref:Cyclic nucleotide-binding domain-containing protein n=1 Tax=Syphacia muris TaxID=451379 RepID=A0A0N5AG90_9BILA